MGVYGEGEGMGRGWGGDNGRRGGEEQGGYWQKDFLAYGQLSADS